MYTLRGTLVALAGLALVGCSGASNDNTTSSTSSVRPSATVTTSSATPSASPTPSPPAPTQTASGNTASGDPCKDPSVSLVGLAGIDFDRYANICIGMSFAQASAAMEGPAIAGDASCPWYATVLEFGDPGLYVAAISDVDNPGNAIFMFRMTWQSDQASAVAFDAPATPADITVGSTTAQVKAAYPKGTVVSLNDLARGTRTQIVVSQPEGTSFVFDVTDGFVTDIYWGTGLSQGSGGELCAL